MMQKNRTPFKPNIPVFQHSLRSPLKLFIEKLSQKWTSTAGIFRCQGKNLAVGGKGETLKRYSVDVNTFLLQAPKWCQERLV